MNENEVILLNDYIISIDENGQVYLAHAFWNRKGKIKQNHKYIEKIVDGAKTRYFYTQQELDAYKQKAKNVIAGNEKKRKEGLGIAFEGAIRQSNAINKGSNSNANKTAKLAADLINQYDEGQKLLEKGVKQYNDNRNLPSRAYDKIVDAAETAANKLNDKVNTATDKIKDKAGVDEYDRWDKAADDFIAAWNERSKVGQELNNIQGELNKTLNPFKYKKLTDEYETTEKKYDELDKKVNETEAEMNKRRKEYDKTLLGKMENIAVNASEAVEKAGKIIPATAELTRSKFDRMKSDLSKKKEARLEQERAAFVDEIAQLSMPMVNYVQEHLKELKKSKQLVYDSETNEAVQVYKYLNTLADRREEAGEKYMTASNSKDREKYEQEIRRLTDDMFYLLDDFEQSVR